MKNLMNKIRKANKGFTLVELIIVVAIIAVLSAVAAPQYIKYVERSRQGTDAAALEEVRHAVEVEVGIMETVAEGSVTVDKDGNLSGTGSFTNASGADTSNFDQVTAVVGPKITLKSKAATRSAVQNGAAAASFTIDIDANGQVSWGTCSPEVSDLQAGKAQ